MDDWTPMVVLPNLNMQAKFECEHAAIVPMADDRVAKLCSDYPTLATFLSKFTNQRGNQIQPSVLLVRAEAPKTYYTAEAVSAFRDILSLSTMPYARALRLCLDRAQELSFTNTLQFYPWMIGAQYKDVILDSPAECHLNCLEKFAGQSFPEQSRASITESDIDRPLATKLLGQWLVRFSGRQVDWEDRALFRSLNMANEAARMPAYVAGTFYDHGRSLALWVSAFEILVHPGNGESNFKEVNDILESIKWESENLSTATHTVTRKKNEQQVQLATWILRVIYDLRHDFLHGNDVEASALKLNGKLIVDLTACLFRLALMGKLDLYFNEPEPSTTDMEAWGAWSNRRTRFNKFQRTYEAALLTVTKAEKKSHANQVWDSA